MDAFWGITLSAIAISKFWKREKREEKESKYQKERLAEKIEEQKKKELIEKYTEIFRTQPPTAEEKEAEKARKKAEKEKEVAEKKKEKEIEDLRKQGYTDELIAVIIPTVNNGQ